MSGGAFVRYSSTWDPAAVRALLADITGGGLTLGHPTTGLVSFIGADGPDSGTHLHTTPDGIAELATLTDRDELSFRFWFPDGRDLRCRLRRLHRSLYATEFDLDGEHHERQQALAIVLATIRRELADVTAFLVDLPGRALEVDWDAVVQGARERITMMPSLLCVPASVADAHPELGTISRCDDTGLGELVAIGDLDLIGLSSNPTTNGEEIWMDVHRALDRLLVTASSSDELIRVAVGWRGDLRNVWLDPRVLHHSDADALAQGVLQIAREAVARALAEAGTLARPLMNRRADEAVDTIDAIFDSALSELERMNALRPPPPRSDGRPVLGPLDVAPIREALLRHCDKVRNTRVAAVSPDGLITATVGGRGELIGLELDARVFKRGDARWLASVIVTTADAAVEKARLS